jgi:cell division inhibitor SulA
MNPILHDLQNKQWIWTAANAKQEATNKYKKTSGYDGLDKVLSQGFPEAGLIHVESVLGCGELRLMLSILQQQNAQSGGQKLYMFIDPPFALNAEFLLAQNIPLSQLVLVHTSNAQDALWSAEQSAKSGACCAVFIWQYQLKHIQVRKLENAALQGHCHCIWLQNCLSSASLVQSKSDHNTTQSNLPLSLSLSIHRQGESLSIKVNKQKVGWAQQAIKIPLPFNSRSNRALNQCKQHHRNDINTVVPIHANR